MYLMDFILQHLIDVVHSNAKRLLAASQVTVYIDGRERLSAQLKYPSTSDVSFNNRNIKQQRKSKFLAITVKYFITRR